MFDLNYPCKFCSHQLYLIIVLVLIIYWHLVCLIFIEPTRSSVVFQCMGLPFLCFLFMTTKCILIDLLKYCGIIIHWQIMRRKSCLTCMLDYKLKHQLPHLSVKYFSVIHRAKRSQKILLFQMLFQQKFYDLSTYIHGIYSAYHDQIALNIVLD